MDRPSCFISYARNDDEAFVHRLRDMLVQRGVDVWWDRRRMRSRGVRFLQEIDDAIRSTDRMLLVCGPNAAASDYVGHELGVASEACTVVVPVLRLGEINEVVPPRLRQQHVFDLRTDDQTQLEAMCDALHQARDRLAPLDPGLPPQPATVLDRGDVDALEAMVLARLRDPIAITGANAPTSVTGMAGIGKTIAATLLVRRCAVRRSYADGAYFIRAGQRMTGGAILNEVRRRRGDQPTAGESETDAINQLGGLLAGARILVVVDDVWRDDQVLPSIRAMGGTASRLVVTTRRGDILEDLHVQKHRLELPDTASAIKYLARQLSTDAGALPSEAPLVIERCGRLPLALAICAARLQHGTTWPDLLAGLIAVDAGLLERQLSTYEHRGVFTALKAGVDELKAANPELADRYVRLALFPTNAPTPQRIALRLWGARTPAAERSGRQQLVDLADRSLLTYNSAEGWFLLHDLQRDFLMSTAFDPVPEARTLLDSYGSKDELLAAAEGDDWLRNSLIWLEDAADQRREINQLLREETADGGNRWYELRARKGELDGYWVDLGAWDASLDGEPGTTAAGTLARIAVIRSSLRSSSTNTPPALAAAAVRAGLWSRERCLATIRRRPNVTDRVIGMLAIFDFLTPEQRRTYLQQGYTAFGELGRAGQLALLEATFLHPEWSHGSSEDECLDALERVPEDTLDPSHFRPLAGRLTDVSLRRAMQLAARVRLGALAALIKWDVDADGEEEILRLAKLKSNYEYALVLSELARPQAPHLVEAIDALAEDALAPAMQGDSESQNVLRVLLSVVSDAVATAILLAQPAKELPKLLDLSAHHAFQELARLGEEGRALPALAEVARSFEPASFGAGILAAVAARSEPSRRHALVAEVEVALKDQLGRVDVGLEIALSDIAHLLAPLLMEFTAGVRQRLVDAAISIRMIELRLKTIVPLARQLDPANRRVIVASELWLLARTSSGFDLQEPLGLLTQLLDPDQIPAALEVASAARDNGYERAFMSTFMNHLDSADRAEAQKWLFRESQRHLDDPSPTSAHPWYATQLIEEICSHGLEAEAGETAQQLTAALPRAELRARGWASLASHADAPLAEASWKRALDELAAVEDPNTRLEAISYIIGSAGGRRRETLAGAAEDLFEAVEDKYTLARAFRVLANDLDVRARAQRVLSQARDSQMETLLKDLVPALGADDFLDLVTDEQTMPSLERELPPIVRRLGEEGRIEEALKLGRKSAWAREIVFRAATPYLSLNQLRAMLLLLNWTDSDWQTSVGVIERLAALGELEEARVRCSELPPGVPRFLATAGLAKGMSAPDGARRLSANLGVLADFSVDDFWSCLKAAAPLLAQLPVAELHQAYRELLSLIGDRIRLQALPALYLISPMIDSFGGRSATAEALHAVMDASRWWPSYPQHVGRSPVLVPA